MSYILKYTGSSIPDTAAVKKVLDNNNIQILDNSTPKMLLVDNIKDNHLPRMKQELHEWEFFPQENSFKVPDSRKKVGKTGNR